MANMSYHIANLLEKMLSTDKDFRFMATNDLMTELQVNQPLPLLGRHSSRSHSIIMLML